MADPYAQNLIGRLRPGQINTRRVAVWQEGKAGTRRAAYVTAQIIAGFRSMVKPRTIGDAVYGGPVTVIGVATHE